MDEQSASQPASNQVSSSDSETNLEKDDDGLKHLIGILTFEHHICTEAKNEE